MARYEVIHVSLASTERDKRTQRCIYQAIFCPFINGIVTDWRPNDMPITGWVQVSSAKFEGDSRRPEKAYK